MKISVNVQDAQWIIIKAIAEKLGMRAEDLIQQSLDQDVQSMDVWVQRGELLNH